MKRVDTPHWDESRTAGETARVPHLPQRGGGGGKDGWNWTCEEDCIYTSVQRERQDNRVWGDPGWAEVCSSDCQDSWVRSASAVMRTTARLWSDWRSRSVRTICPVSPSCWWDLWSVIPCPGRLFKKYSVVFRHCDCEHCFSNDKINLNSITNKTKSLSWRNSNIQIKKLHSIVLFNILLKFVALKFWVFHFILLVFWI